MLRVLQPWGILVTILINRRKLSHQQVKCKATKTVAKFFNRRSEATRSWKKKDVVGPTKQYQQTSGVQSWYKPMAWRAVEEWCS